ncbi:PHB depolymerase family esterase [Achromobacter sp. MY14]|uniref:extracellular catalytic domain type 1 short-chain-length polyhydroxyalkanoate depolymerase n=1 Tax=unclassified Achromobacter TaxID=2626865 RepID=UPI001E422825|nr:PHB depolymerase family esterase [Achromobacter sp. MY14]MCD0499360.1 PHB depolymerase family esterase [Achromobacter sp. MY14]
MHPEFQQLMSQATRLTRSGNLAAATAAIQAALLGVQPTAASAAPRYDEADVIDVEAREVPARSPSASSPAAAPSPARDDGAAPTSKPTHRAPGESSVTQGDFFTAGSFRNSAGQRAYKLYVPPGVNGQARPLVVMLHGCTQDADDFAAGTAMNEAARKQGFYVLYPVQPRETNPQKCWNWFKHNHQQAGKGEPSILADMTRHVIAEYGIDTRRVYVAGLSAGGAMAAILADTYPQLYAAAGVHSGLAAGAAKDLPSALSAMKGIGVRPGAVSSTPVPTIVFHGDRDATVHPANAGAVVAASAGGDARVQSQRVAGANQGRDSTKRVYTNAQGQVIAEYWEVHGAGHAWAGGSPKGSYTDQSGPDATQEMLRFFFEHPLAVKQ